MPYEQLEEIRSRKQEKIALFLTAQNVAGLLCVAMPVYIATLHFSFVLRTLIVIAAAVLGVCLTLEIGGLPFYERLLCRLRGAIRVRTSGSTLSPDQFTGSSTVRTERALLAGGPIRAVQADERTSQRRVQAGQIASRAMGSVRPQPRPTDRDAIPFSRLPAVVSGDVDAPSIAGTSPDGEAASQVSAHADV